MPAMRDIFPALQQLRNLLLGRKHQSSLRSPKKSSSRDWDSVMPNLPPTENQKLSANDYHARDDRRAVEPPTVIVDAEKAPENGKEAPGAGLKTGKTPGKVYKYSEQNSSDPGQ